MLTHEQMKKANAKFQKGDTMTDREVTGLRDFYSKLALDLRVMGTEFGLAKIEVIRRFDRLDTYWQARGLNSTDTEESLPNDRIQLTRIGNGHHRAKNVTIQGSGLEPRDVDILRIRDIASKKFMNRWMVVGDPERVFTSWSGVRTYFNDMWEHAA